MASWIDRIKGWVKSVLPIGASTEQLLTREATRMKQSYGDTVRQGALRGSSLIEVLTNVRQGVTTSIRNVKTVVATSANAISNKVREAFIKARGLGYVHISILDNRTSLICIERSNLKWDKNRKPVGHNKPFRRPALHYNCRSKLAPWIVGEDLPESYQQWLKKQGSEVQIEVLGKTRREMWINGSLSLRQLTSQNGRPLTIAKLRDRDS